MCELSVEGSFPPNLEKTADCSHVQPNKHAPGPQEAGKPKLSAVVSFERP